MRFFLFLLSLTAIVVLPGRPADAVERRCAGTNATVYAASNYDSYLACAGAADAVAFLAEYGLTVDTVMRIDIRDSVFLHQSAKPAFRVLGQFDPKQDRILVTSVRGQLEMAAEKPIFGVPYDPALFRSVVAHEVAHAIAEDNFQVSEPTRLAHEYIAYIVQLATLPEHLRQAILDYHQVVAFEHELEINPMLYGLNPDVFALKSYGHFFSPGVGSAFLQTLLHRDLLSIFPQWEDRATRDPLDRGQVASSLNAEQ